MEVRPHDAVSQATTAKRKHEAVEMRIALMRLALTLVLAMPLLVLTDLAAVYSGRRSDALAALLALRALGLMISGATFLYLKRTRVPSLGILAIIDFGVLTLSGIVAAERVVILGTTLASTAPGLQALLLVRGTLVPTTWRRALASMACCIAGHLACLAVGFWTRPALAEESRAATGLGFGQILLGALVVVVAACIISHILWTARREVYETQRLGQYRLIAQIGRGGHGEVWLARQEALERDVAIKVLRDVGDDGETAARFRREARLASHLAHPNTIRIIDYGVAASGTTYLAMELLSGTNLDDLVKTAGPLPAPRVIHLARQACASLAEAHDAGIIHRDVKPANLYVTRTGDDHDFLKVLDFGIARANSGSTVTREGDLVGTLAYMSPEMCSGDKVDARSDIYSLGATLYFMLTRHLVFRGTMARVMEAHLSELPKLPSARLGYSVPEDLEQVIMRCLAKAPEDRYATMRDVDAALAACADAGRWTTGDSSRAWRAARAVGPDPRPASP
jgi:serine/threonine-protein kinase